MRGYIEIEGYKEQNRVREGTEGGGQERQGTVRIGQRGGEHTALERAHRAQGTKRMSSQKRKGDGGDKGTVR